MRVFLGWDSKEQDAYRVAEHTLLKTSGIVPEPLKLERLQANGLLRRPVDWRGQPWDLPSSAPCSTEFSVSRFLVPILCQSGPALFADCDVVFLDDVHKLLAHFDESKAVMVVKHNHIAEGSKMVGLRQTSYGRKNWSSVMLFNCDHPANRRLTVADVNERPGRDLHQFYWLHDSEVGDLPPEWNWLVGVQPKPKFPKLAHFTLGGPWLDNWQFAEHDDLWLSAYKSV